MSAGMSPDARLLVLPVVERQSDVWMVENPDPDLK